METLTKHLSLYTKTTDYFIASFVVLTLFGAYRHANPIYFGRLRLRNLTRPPPPYDKAEFDWRKGIPATREVVEFVPVGDLVFETEQGVRDVFVRVDRARVESER
jgi:hypothetical protein